MPEIKYSDTKISIPEEEPIYLYSKNKNKIGVIDINNQISQGERSKMPIILTANKLIINLVEVATKKKLTTEFEYFKIFEPGPKILTPEVIKRYCADELAKFINIFTYIGLPVLVIVWFVMFLFEKSFIVLLVYVLANLFGPKALMKTCVRLVMLSSGVPVLLQPLITLLLPALGEIVLLTQIYTVVLLFIALWQIKNKEALRV